jgi:hypothetical protein
MTMTYSCLGDRYTGKNGRVVKIDIDKKTGRTNKNLIFSNTIKYTDSNLDTLKSVHRWITTKSEIVQLGLSFMALKVIDCHNNTRANRKAYFDSEVTIFYKITRN